MNKSYLQQALFKKTNCIQITEACYKAEFDTGVSWKCVYDFIRGRSLPRIDTLKILQKYLEIDLNKTII